MALVFLCAPALSQLERVARDPARRARASLNAALLMAAAFAAHVQYGGRLDRALARILFALAG
ncbi:MAG TPA: hypothetical protein VMF89_36095, partial [Polyangiales bacterium]|nr:hypothetical protein [Polyangiales bacterium]